ncbi:MAG: hypothetical protein ACREQV_26980 [Candidatus Binatia bacterium]
MLSDLAFAETWAINEPPAGFKMCEYTIFDSDGNAPSGQRVAVRFQFKDGNDWVNHQSHITDSIECFWSVQFDPGLNEWDPVPTEDRVALFEAGSNNAKAVRSVDCQDCI